MCPDIDLTLLGREGLPRPAQSQQQTQALEEQPNFLPPPAISFGGEKPEISKARRHRTAGRDEIVVPVQLFLTCALNTKTFCHVPAVIFRTRVSPGHIAVVGAQPALLSCPWRISCLSHATNATTGAWSIAVDAVFFYSP